MFILAKVFNLLKLKEEQASINSLEIFIALFEYYFIRSSYTHLKGGFGRDSEGVSLLELCSLGEGGNPSPLSP